MKSVFESKAGMPREPGTREPDAFIENVASVYPPESSIHTMMTPADQRALQRSRYPRYDAMDVKHAPRPRRGHDY